MPNSNTYTRNIPIGAISGTLTGILNSNAIASITNYSMDYSISSQSDSPDLPALIIATSDEKGNKVHMTLNPEHNISSHECMKLMMLVTAMTVSPQSFNALAHVKKNNLERHFTFS